jgi:hypothetical protein
MNPNPFSVLKNTTVPFFKPFSLLGLATVDLQSASDPSHVHVTFPPSFEHVHFATTCSVATSAGAADMGSAEAGVSLDIAGAEAADGAEAVELEPQPESSSAPAAAIATAIVVTNLGACTAQNLSSSPRCTRSDSTEYCCASDHGQVRAGFREEAVRKTGPCLRFHSWRQAQCLDICVHQYEGFST